MFKNRTPTILYKMWLISRRGTIRFPSGTREAPFGLSVLFQKCRNQSLDVYQCLIDYEKFNRVKHTELINLFYERGVDQCNINLIKNL